MADQGSLERNEDRPSLSMDERIVWISDNGPEYGNVRWLGKLQDFGKEWMAGVEFDNPVGSGTGLYKDRQLFIAPLNHASLVPVIGLLKASDFDDHPPLPPPPNPPTRISSASFGNYLIDINEDRQDLIHNNNNNRRSNFIDNNNVANDKQHHHHQSNTNNSYALQSRNIAQILASKDKAGRYSSNPNQTSKVTTSRVHNIPIRVEGRESVDRFVQSNQQQHPLTASSKKPTLPAKPSKQINSIVKKQSDVIFDPIDSISNNLSKTTINERKVSPSPTEGIPLLPPPSLVVGPDEKNPGLALKNMLGKSRGIQGHNNSCYLDATLFAMFSSTTLFDSLLYRPPDRNDIPKYREIQRILREAIVRPLREEYMVNADQVMLFRTMLEQSSTVAGLTDEEKDPEEFLSLLLSQILKAEPYLKLSSGLESFFYQLIVDKDESVILPSVQDLFEQSFMNSTVRLREIPPCLLLQMPRFGRQYKMYSRIMPSLKLDITDVLEAAPRSCGHRGKDCDNIARYECKDCFGERSGRYNARLSNITYCSNCFQAKHFGKSHSTGIEDHDKTKTILDKTPKDAISRYSNKNTSTKDKEVPRICMDLFAVLCIETSHYVCFVKCGQASDAPWCFFDSMADRRGEQNGYNIPEVLLFDEFPFWTSDKGISYLLNHKDDKLLPEMARRLVCDAYLCFYQYNGLMTYR